MAQELRSFQPLHIHLHPPSRAATTLPELQDADYGNEVLRSSIDNQETYLDELIAKAANLGISFSRPPSPISMPDNHDSSGAESNRTFDTTHARTVSTASRQSVRTALTSHSSNSSHYPTGNILTRRRSRALTFAQYEKSFSDFQPNSGQSKLVPTPLVTSVPRRFSVKTRKSYKMIRDSMSRLRDRRRIVTLSEALIM